VIRLAGLIAKNYRCFTDLDVAFEHDCTVVHAENGGGKTALLNAVATLLASWFTPAQRTLDAGADVRRARTATGSWEPQGDCYLLAEAVVDGRQFTWSRWLAGARNRSRLAGLRDAAREVVVPGRDWPLLAYYGTQRLWQTLNRTERKRGRARERSDGYVDCLDPRSSESQLVDWMSEQATADVQRQFRHEPPLGFLDAVTCAIRDATPGVRNLHFDLSTNDTVVEFDDGTESGWDGLSDGYHVFLALVADIARRAVTLNDHLGADAPRRTGGVVLIDEIDLHLHPRWQRTVVAGLRTAFPGLQFIVTTHSPQVLGSVENRQVRRLERGKLVAGTAFVHGRDTNAILRDVMGSDDRDARGREILRSLYDAVDTSDFPRAERELQRLSGMWGELDPEVVRAHALLSWQR
jgi:predicted ATP-binding protein involved in virulence